jgi:ABC-2 type transport system permease protein
VQRLIAVIDRDIRKFMRNPIIMVMSVVLPIAYLVILGNSFQGKLKKVPVVVVNQDQGPFGRRVVENLRAVQAGPETVTISTLLDQREAVEGVRDGEFKAAVIIPPDFTSKAAKNTGPEVGLFVDNTDQISANTLEGTVSAAISPARDLFVPVRPDRAKINTRRVDLYQAVDYDQALVPGVVVMAMFMGTMITGVFNLVMDRFLGTDEAILMTPITKMDIVGGLIISGFFITLAMAVLVYVCSVAITGLPLYIGFWGLAGMLIIMALTTMGLLSMMFLLLGRANHPRMVGVLSGFLNVIFFFPSGAVYPVEGFPVWLKAFSKVNPEFYAVHAMKSVLFKHAPLSVVYGDILFLMVFTAVMMSLAVTTFKRTL